MCPIAQLMGWPAGVGNISLSVNASLSQVSQCFPLNGREDNPGVLGVQVSIRYMSILYRFVGHQNGPLLIVGGQTNCIGLPFCCLNVGKVRSNLLKEITYWRNLVRTSTAQRVVRALPLPGPEHFTKRPESYPIRPRTADTAEGVSCSSERISHFAQDAECTVPAFSCVI